MCAGDPAAPPDEPAAPVVVTLRDIASFRPATPGNGMEPGGWAIEGLPANFVAAASVQVVSGTLLGQPADVRFTPVGYRWSHGDGGVLEHGEPGSTWEALGQREFTETPTSHVYAVAGEYTVDLSVVLRAEYRFAGSPWRPIAGTLSARRAAPARTRRRVRHRAHAGRLHREPLRPGLLTRSSKSRAAPTGSLPSVRRCGDRRRSSRRGAAHSLQAALRECRPLAVGAGAVAQQARRRLPHGIEIARLRQLPFEQSDESVEGVLGRGEPA